MERWENYREVLGQKEICTFCSITSMRTSFNDFNFFSFKYRKIIYNTKANPEVNTLLNVDKKMEKHRYHFVVS